MNIENISYEPVSESIDPEILFKIPFLIQENEIPIEITGSIFSGDKKIANINRISEEPREIKLSAKTGNIRKPIIKAVAQLSQNAIRHIEIERKKNKQGDIILNLKIYVKMLYSRTIISSLILSDPISSQDLGIKYQQNNPAVLYRYGAEPEKGDMFILSGDNGPVFIEIQNIELSPPSIEIPSSKWIYEYVPKFGLGEYEIFEIPYPKIPSIQGFGDIINRLKEAGQSLLEGHNDDAVVKCRKAIETLNPLVTTHVNDDKGIMLQHLANKVDLLSQGQIGKPAKSARIENVRRYIWTLLHIAAHEGYFVTREDAELVYWLTFSLVRYYAIQINK